MTLYLTQVCFVPSVVVIDLVTGNKRFLNVVNEVRCFAIGKGRDPSLNPLFQEMFYVKFSWNFLDGSGEEDKCHQCIFTNIFHYLSLEKVMPFIRKYLNFLQPRMRGATFGWICPRGYGENDFLASCLWKFESIDICNYFSIKKNWN